MDRFDTRTTPPSGLIQSQHSPHSWLLYMDHPHAAQFLWPCGRSAFVFGECWDKTSPTGGTAHAPNPSLCGQPRLKILSKLCRCSRTPLTKKIASPEQCLDHRGSWVAKVYFGLKGKSKSSLQCNPAIKRVLERAKESTHGWRRSDDRRNS